ncbi:MAG: DUF2231 domain-containing protein [Sphingomicrobium sp.]
MATDIHRAAAPAGFAYAAHLLLGSFPFAFFSFALVTDIVYWKTANLMWQYFSIWLITAALVMGALAVLAGLIDFALDRGQRARRGAWLHFAVTVAALLLGLLNAFVHSRDGWTAVVPQGIILSALVVLLMIAGGALGAWAERTA